MEYPVRVAQVMGYMNGGGVEQFIMNYYRHIDRDRIQFDFIVCDGSTLIPKREIEALGGHVYILPPYSRLFDFQRRIFNLFEERHWPIVHSHMNALSVFPLAMARKAGVPIRIAHSHNTSGKGECIRNCIKDILRSQANRYPTHRFACSTHAGSWLFGDKVDFDIIPNAMDLSRFTFSDSQRKLTRDHMGISEDEFVILHVGRFVPQKNHRFIVEMFSQFVRTHRNSTLLLVGAGSDELRIKQLVSSLGLSTAVQFLGQRKDVERLYMAADVFVLPSRYEGLGIVGIEAQAAGLPCLFSDVVPREIQVTEKCSFLPIDDWVPWVEAIERLKLERSEKRYSSFNHAFMNYDINHQAPLLVDRYLGLIERESNGSRP